MRKVRKALSGIAFFLISVAMVFGLLFNVTSKDAIGARADGDVSYVDAHDVYRLSYSNDEIKLLLNANPSVYKNISKETATELKNSLVSVFKEVLNDDLDLDNLSQNSAGRKLPSRLPGAPAVDTSALEAIIAGQLGSIEAIENAAAQSGTYDTLLSFYVDRYVANYVEENNVAEEDKAQVYQDVQDSIATALQNQVEAVYVAEGATPEEVAAAQQDISDKVADVVADVKETNDAGDSVQINLSDVKEIANSITADDIAAVIEDIDVKEEVKNIVTSSSAEELTDFLSTVDMESIVKVVEKVEINADDLTDIIDTVGADNLIDVVNTVGVDALKDLANAANLSKDDLQQIVADKMSEVSLSNLTKLISSVQVDGHEFYADGGFVSAGIKYVIKSIPHPAEIANFTDDQMRLTYHLSIETTFGGVETDFTIGFFGNCDYIRRAAQLLADTVDVQYEDEVLKVVINAPEKTSDALLRFAESTAISDELKLKVFDTAFLPFDEMFESVDLQEYIELLKGVDYQTVVNTLTSASELNEMFNTEKFTDEKVEKFINAFNKLADTASTASYDSVKQFVNQFKEGALDNATLDSLVSRVQNLLAKVAGRLDYDKLREYAQEGTGLDPVAELDKLANDQAKLDKIQKVIDKLHDLVPEADADKSLVDLYDGEGHFSYVGDHNLNVKGLLNKVFGSTGDTIYDRLSPILSNLPNNISVDVQLNLSGVYKVTYHYGDEEKTGLLPAGADVKFFGNKDEVSAWVLADGTAVEEMPEEDVEVYADFAVEANEGVDTLEFVYDGHARTIASEITPSDIYNYTYQWTKDGQAIAGATNATIDVTDVADSGVYQLEVTAEELGLSRLSNEVTVAISPAEIDVSGFAWDYTAAIQYDGQNHEVKVVVPAQYEGLVNVTLAGDTTAKEVGKYHATAEASSLNANYVVTGSIQALDWEILGVEFDLSTLQWDYTAPYTFTGEAQSVMLKNVPDFLEITYKNNSKTNAGSYKATATATTDDPSKILTGSIANLSWKIEKKVIDATAFEWDYTTALVYNGNEQEVLLKNNANLELVSVKYLGNTGTGADQYKAVAFVTALDSNHSVSGQVPSLNWEISKAQIDVSGLAWNYTDAFTYDGNNKSVTLKNVPENVTISYQDNVKADAGSYTAKATATAVGANYQVTGQVADLSWTISQAAIDVSGLAWDYTNAFIYDGNAKTVTLKNVPSSVTIAYQDNVKTNVGTYTAKATATAVDANYVATGNIADLAWEIKAGEPVSVIRFFDANNETIAEVTNQNGTFPGTYTLNIGANGLPEGTDYSELLGKGQKVQAGTAYDVKFLDNGTPVALQNGKYRVKLAIPEALLEYPDNRLKVVYIDDSGVIKEEFKFEREGNFVIFETTHFSVYAVIGLSEPSNLWWIWLIVIAVILIIILILLLCRKRFSTIEVYKDSGKIYVDGVEVKQEEAQLSTIEVMKDSGKIFVDGVEVKDDSQLPPSAGDFDVIEVMKDSGDIKLNGVKESEDETIVIQKKNGSTFIDDEEVDYSYYNNLNHSYKARLIRTNDKTKEYYSAIKNEVLSYKNGKKEVSNRTSWKHETFSSERQQLVELKMRRTSLVVILPLNASDYVDTKYRVEDAKEGKVAYAINNDRRCKYAKELIATVMANAGLSKVEREEVDYTAELKTKDVDQLLAEGLIKK